MGLKQLGTGPELFHCHITLTLEAFVYRVVTSVGVGGAGGVKMDGLKEISIKLLLQYLLLVEKPLW